MKVMQTVTMLGVTLPMMMIKMFVTVIITFITLIKHFGTAQEDTGSLFTFVNFRIIVSDEVLYTCKMLLSTCEETALAWCRNF